MPQWNFLWITDLHYGNPANRVDDPKEGQGKKKALREEVFPGFYLLLEEAFADVKLDFIGIGGDITDQGNPAGFDRYRAEMFSKLSALVEKQQAICVVPGNHDVVWGLDPAKNDYFDVKFGPFRDLVKGTNATTCLLPTGRLSDEDPVTLYPLGRGPLYSDEASRTVVLTVNSAMRCGELNTELRDILRASLKQELVAEIDKTFHKHLIHDVAEVSPPQLQELRTRLRAEKKRLGAKWSESMRVAIVHHHLVHFPGQVTEHRGYEFMVDSSKLLDLLAEFDFHIVLTGHKHKAYHMKHLRGEKEIFIVGGTTVGGYTSDGTRGLRLITLDSNPFRRKLTIKDVPWQSGEIDAQTALKKAKTEELQFSTTGTQMLAALEQKAGFRYRDVIYCTRITKDGDALRQVECHDLKIKDALNIWPRLHEVELPYTSGYLDKIAAQSRTAGLDVDIKAKPEAGAQRGTLAMELRTTGVVEGSIDYDYRWYAVNSYAQDQLQFDRKYPPDTPLKHREFTYFNPTDPIGRLTMIVQFPAGLTPREPSMRIVRKDDDVDMRLWKAEDAETKSMAEHHVLRYIRLYNAFVLTVKGPKDTLSYGIEWKLPESPDWVQAEAVTQAICKYLKPGRDVEPLKRVLYEMLDGMRETLLGGWKGNLDGNLMIFGMPEAPRMLTTVVAGVSPTEGALEKVDLSAGSASPVGSLEYGHGVAGRAFKTNRIRIWGSQNAAAASREEDAEPNFYVQIPNSPEHSSLASFPLHVPVSDSYFGAESEVYEKRMTPYGVFTIGSDDDDCPIPELWKETDESRSIFQTTQQRLNRAFGDVIFKKQSIRALLKSVGIK